MKVTLATGSVEEGDPDSSAIPLSLLQYLGHTLSELIPDLWKESVTYKEIEISLRFISPQEMRSLNRAYRGMDRPTDVLSFSLWEGDTLPDPEDWQILPMGDIVLCPEVILENSRQTGKNLLEELCLMISHGLLHLMGWEHGTEAEECLMWEEQAILSSRLYSAIPDPEKERYLERTGVEKE